jgi:hypothetical protein
MPAAEHPRAGPEIYVLCAGEDLGVSRLLAQAIESFLRIIRIAPFNGLQDDGDLSPDVMQTLGDADAVLLVLSSSVLSSSWLSTATERADGRLVVASLELEGRSVFRRVGVMPVELGDWNGDPRDPRVTEVVDQVRRVLEIPANSGEVPGRVETLATSAAADSGRPGSVGSPEPEGASTHDPQSEQEPYASGQETHASLREALANQPDPDHEFAFSDSAQVILGWSSFIATDLGDLAPNASTVLLMTALAHRPPWDGVGRTLLRVLASRQGRADDVLLARAAPWAASEPSSFGLTVPDSRFSGLAALAERCAERVSGRPEIHLRHLLAAAVLAGRGTAEGPPLQPDALSGLGTSARELPELLLGVVRETRHGDSLEAWEALLAARLAGGFDPDLVDPGRAIARERDDLGHGVWAAMFASLIADRETPLPVSIGLFGEWGSGKSTFMGLLRGEIEALCGQPGRVGDVVQIGFNAWHYADANLWASLGDEIFRKLADALTADDQREPAGEAAALLAKITAKRGLAEEARVRRDQAEYAAKAQGERLATQVREARQDKQVKAGALVTALLKSPEVEKKAGQAWKRLGVSDQVKQGELLAGELDGISQDSRALRSLLGWRLTWALAAVCLVALLLTLAAHVFGGEWGTWLGGLGTWLRHYGAFSTLAAVLASAAALAGRVRAGLAALRAAAEQAAGQGSEKSKQEIEAARDGLRAAQARERVADAELDRVNADLAALERQLASLAPGQRMYTFLAERAASEDYAGQLGLVSIIRKDLEHLVEVLRQHHRQLDERDSSAGPGQPGEPDVRRIDRIVLYIDDLDRCQPRQVVEVLQAVHLLLALDLFVVVVGVDPRWLVKSLHEQYSGILADGGERLQAHGSSSHAMTAAGDGGLAGAVPADYLQKIFNIPFMLPAFGRDQMRQLITGLARERPVPCGGTPSAGEVAYYPTGEPGSEAIGVPSADGTATGATVVIPREVPTVAPVSPAAASRTVPGTTTESAALAAQRLTEEEIRFLGGLGPFVETPRDAKRLFNVYRMLRAAGTLSPASAFLDGEYQATALLLAMLTLDPPVFARLLDAPPLPDLGISGGLAQRPMDAAWAAFAADLRPRPPEVGGILWQNAVIGDIPAAEVAAWWRMADAVGETSALVTLSALTAFQSWAPHVRRFSYLVLSPDL